MTERMPSAGQSAPPGLLWVISGLFLAGGLWALILVGKEVLSPAGSPTTAGLLTYPAFGVGFCVSAYQILRGNPQGRRTAHVFARVMQVLAPVVTVALYGFGMFVDGALFDELGLGWGIHPYSAGGFGLSIAGVLGIVGMSVWVQRALDREEVRRYFRS